MTKPHNTKAACHKLLKATAEEMAGTIYEDLVRDNDWYRLWQAAHPGVPPRKLQAVFIRYNWAQLVNAARATLTQLLSTPISPALKDEIHEALILDNSLPVGQVTAAN